MVCPSIGGGGIHCAAQQACADYGYYCGVRRLRCGVLLKVGGCDNLKVCAFFVDSLFAADTFECYLGCGFVLGNRHRQLGYMLTRKMAELLLAASRWVSKYRRRTSQAKRLSAGLKTPFPPRFTTWVYISVVLISECPNNSWMVRKSYPDSSRWVAKLCLKL